MGEKRSFGMSNILLSQDVGRFLKTVLWVFLGFLMLGSLANHISPSEINRIVARNSLAMAAITAISLMLLRKNRISQAIVLMIVGCGVVLFGAAWNGTGLRGPAFAAFVLLVLGVSQYWGQRAGYWAVLIASCAGFILLFAERFGWLVNQPLIVDDWFSWATFTATFILAALMNGLMLRYLERSMSQLREEQEKIRRLNEELEQRVAERAEQLAESERLLKIISENVQDILWTTDLQMRTTFITESAARLRGFTVQEMLEEPIHKALTPDSYALVMDILREEIENEARGGADPNRSRVVHLDYYRKDGSTIRMEARASFLRDEQGNPIGITGINRDITERNWMEKALLDSEERYRKITSVISDYIRLYWQ